MSDNANHSYGGLVPCGVGGQGAYTGSIRRYVHPSGDGTAIYLYQPVKRDGNADATTGLSTVIAAGDTDTPCGICIGIEVRPTALNTKYTPASTRVVLLVADDPLLEFIGVGDDAGTTLDITHAGLNLTWESAGITSDTQSGYSLYRLDSSTVNTTNTLNVRLIKIYEEVGQNIADGDKYKKWVCKFNLHQDTSTTGV